MLEVDSLSGVRSLQSVSYWNGAGRMYIWRWSATILWLSTVVEVSGNTIESLTSIQITFAATIVKRKSTCGEAEFADHKQEGRV